MNSRYLRGILTLCAVITLVLSINTKAFASTKDVDPDHIDVIYTSDILGDEKPDEKIEIYREKGTERNLIIKELTTNSYKENEVALVEGGNMNAINPLATKQHIAKADMTENVGEGGKEFEIFLEDDNGEPAFKQTRQFVTFTTKSGKTFHLIIDHEKASQNVFLLTEVGEQDLLNMIEGEKSNINVKPMEKEISKEEEPKEEDKQVEQKPKVKNKLSFPVVLIILGAVIGAGYYFKIYKPKQEDFEDEYNEYELEYEEEYDEEI